MMAVAGLDNAVWVELPFRANVCKFIRTPA